MPFEHPGPKLREYVLAVRAIWRAFQGEEPLAVRRRLLLVLVAHRLLLARPERLSPTSPSRSQASTPAWRGSPARSATGSTCTRSTRAGTSTRSSARRSRRAPHRTGRDASACEVFCPVFVIVGDTDAEQAPAPRLGPTPALVLRLDPHVPPGLRAPRLGGHQRAAPPPHGEGRHRRDGRASSPTRCSTSTRSPSTWDGLAPALIERYAGLADRVFSYGAAQAWIESPQLAERWRAVAAAFSAHSA